MFCLALTPALAFVARALVARALVERVLPTVDLTFLSEDLTFLLVLFPLTLALLLALVPLTFLLLLTSAEPLLLLTLFPLRVLEAYLSWLLLTDLPFVA